MLDLIEHLASGVKDVPLLILCLARKDLLDERPAWGGGNVRSTSIELEALPLDGQRAARRRARRRRVGRAVRRAARGGARDDRGQPALHRGDGANAARVRRRVRRDSAHRAGDDLCAGSTGCRSTERTVLRRAAVAGRVFWSGAIEELGDSPIDGGELHDLVERDFLVREPRSTIRGEEAYRFKHVLIRDVAYAGLSKSSRALLHRQMARVARGAAGRGRARRDPGLPPRRGRRSSPRSSRGASRPSSRPRLPRRSSRRVGARSRARRTASPAGCFSRSVELEPNARAALPRGPRCLADVRLPDRLGRDARGERGGAARRAITAVEGRALTALARVSLFRDADNACARELAGRALDVVEQADDVGRFDALEVLGTVCVLGGRPRGGRAAGERAARDRGADRARRPPERACCSS